jgi:NAD(P)-dependent dehydrogenase (short-subunit alcohol dehydrogenase family)
MADGSSSTYVSIVTGATRGIGRATAETLAQRGATVVTLGRDPERSTIVCDLASFASIRAAAAEIARRWPRVHLLVNNAGVHHATRQLSADGIERTFAVNHLAPFLLTRLLLPNLRDAGSARVVMVSSSLARWGKIHFDDVQLTRRYEGTRAYLQSKLANIMFTRSLAEELAGTGVTAACVYPGLVATDLLRERRWWRVRWLRPLWRAIFLTPSEAARAVVTAATADASDRGDACFSVNGRLVPTPRRARDAEARRRLWQLSTRLVSAS